MARTYELSRKLVIPRPIQETFRFFADAQNLQQITPDFLRFRIVTTMPVEMAQGTLLDYQIRLFGIPINWRTIIDNYDPPNKFVDRQLAGPYKLWHHTHLFKTIQTADGVATEMTDHVRYQLSFGPIGKLANVVFVSRTLERIFDYRNQEISRHFGCAAE